MIRRGFVMSVFPEHAGEYRRRHNPIWPELESVLKAHGVSTYTIFLHPGTHQLFAYVEFDNEERWRAIAETDICLRWWAHMKEIMPSNLDNSPIASDLQEVFHI